MPHIEVGEIWKDCVLDAHFYITSINVEMVFFYWLDIPDRIDKKFKDTIVFNYQRYQKISPRRRKNDSRYYRKHNRSCN
jgi:hypothetical protein